MASATAGKTTPSAPPFEQIGRFRRGHNKQPASPCPHHPGRITAAAGHHTMWVLSRQPRLLVERRQCAGHDETLQPLRPYRLLVDQPPIGLIHFGPRQSSVPHRQRCNGVWRQADQPAIGQIFPPHWRLWSRTGRHLVWNMVKLIS